IKEGESLQNYGLDSIMAMRLAANLGKRLKADIETQWLIEFPTVKELAKHLTKEANRQFESVLTEKEKPERNHTKDIVKVIRGLVKQVLQIEDFDDEKSFQAY